MKRQANRIKYAPRGRHRTRFAATRTPASQPRIVSVDVRACTGSARWPEAPRTCRQRASLSTTRAPRHVRGHAQHRAVLHPRRRPRKRSGAEPNRMHEVDLMAPARTTHLRCATQDDHKDEKTNLLEWRTVRERARVARLVGSSCSLEQDRPSRCTRTGLRHAARDRPKIQRRCAGTSTARKHGQSRG